MCHRVTTALFVAGGRIDHAHHYNNAYRALDETLALESALLAAMELVDITETLIVLTADHSHVLTLGGLATPRGNPILGKACSRSRPYAPPQGPLRATHTTRGPTWPSSPAPRIRSLKKRISHRKNATQSPAYVCPAPVAEIRKSLSFYLPPFPPYPHFPLIRGHDTSKEYHPHNLS